MSVKSLLAWIMAIPPLAHAAEASIETLFWIGVGHGVGALLQLALPIPDIAISIVSALVAFVLVASVYYGREAGQREHDLKNRGVDAVTAWLGARLWFRWTGSNWAQWLSPCGSSAAVCGLVLAAPLLR